MASGAAGSTSGTGTGTGTGTALPTTSELVSKLMTKVMDLSSNHKILVFIEILPKELVRCTSVVGRSVGV